MEENTQQDVQPDNGNGLSINDDAPGGDGRGLDNKRPTHEKTDKISSLDNLDRVDVGNVIGNSLSGGVINDEDEPTIATDREEVHVKNKSHSSHRAPLVVVVALLVGLLMVAVAFMAYRSTNGKVVIEETAQKTKEVSDKQLTDEKKMVNELHATLKDVTATKSSEGSVSAKSYDNNTYELTAKFNNLPNKAANDFFEGWLVNKKTGKFISTGRVEQSESGVLNTFMGDEDYQEQGYTLYVLTLEPDDGNPKPARHVLEGELNVVKPASNTQDK